MSDQILSLSEEELWDIVSQMKALVEQNEAQARSTLISHPAVGLAVLKAQIRLGMVTIQSISSVMAKAQPTPPAQPIQPVQQAQPLSQPPQHVQQQMQPMQQQMMPGVIQQQVQPQMQMQMQMQPMQQHGVANGSVVLQPSGMVQQGMTIQPGMQGQQTQFM